jgi:hypothetical protein
MLWKCYNTKSKQTNQIFITMLNNDASRINTLEFLDTLYTFYLAQFIPVPYFFPDTLFNKKEDYVGTFSFIRGTESVHTFSQIDA